MTDATAKAQMIAMEKTRIRATASKAAALRFLREAGITRQYKRKSKTKAITKKSK